MGRIRTFTEVEVARTARQVFWDRGYEDTALPDLERATGLNRSSIYHSFGSKRGLFDAAVENYLDEVIRPRLAPLRGDTVESAALETYLLGLHAAMTEGHTALAANGCLLLNATGSPLGRDASLQTVVAAYCDDLRTAITAGVAARRADLDEAEQKSLAVTCTGLVFAAMAIVRVNAAAAGDLIEAALAQVRR
ncbi:TetR/AcrR family transcriptional regulator [Subtercola sp. Z020]|uniref:TetR/AcrR family transcriptional regulator n=1 Tax=Subtercola sp. Z020 TaxID=2080582 RepID=UPI000CE91777|nr:TetR/AcrR family transcriptional regulator [Subtercola sp. Z020]PPF79537.1 TetR/AcrR family transcriptional regulator [Subtercola sp. Z020]